MNNKRAFGLAMILFLAVSRVGADPTLRIDGSVEATRQHPDDLTEELRSLPGVDRSTACPGERWICRVSPAGEMSFALSRDLDWGSLSGVAVPTSYVAPAPAR